MMQQLSFEGNPERIDTWLTKQFPYSRNFFHHILERKGILLNGSPAKKSSKLKGGDTILIDDLERCLSPLILEEAPALEIPILKETPDYLVINKPKGVLSHPNSLRDVAQPSVVGFLYHRYKSLPSIGNFIRAGLIHRLDKETDGLMIIVKSERGLQHFKALFQAKSEAPSLAEKNLVPLKKWYRATCEVTPQGQEFLHQIADQLPFVISEPVQAKVPHSVAKLGITQIEAIQKPATSCGSSDRQTLLLQLFTGRTHQIRVHLSSHGLPIVGDYLYGKEDILPLQLTAYQLSFRDPEGEEVVVEI